MIYWLEQLAEEHPELDSPARFLSPEEMAQLEAMRVPRRRMEWLLGRWTAKRLLGAFMERVVGLEVPWEAIAVKAEPGGAPFAELEPLPGGNWRGGRLPLGISLSHRAGRALCALSPYPGTRLGADLEKVEPRSEAFVRDFFSPEELEAVERVAPGRERDLLCNLAWSGKEAFLKAAGVGLRADARKVTCLPADGSLEGEGWMSLRVRPDPELVERLELAGVRVSGWWRGGDGFVRTMVLLWLPAGEAGSA